ncbi:DNA-binding protein [Magnetovibrio sp. PR-2]|uniref:DNA-binding protein n=1 Tax=Magnetovibrio sp. PR-2 TaxID=3120356 RepID=UPI002FCE51E6
MTNFLAFDGIRPVNWRVNDFCRAHGIGRTFFYEQVKLGKISTIKVGNRTLVPDSEALAWQERNMETRK